MTKNVRIGIIRARHDTTVPVISDAACLAMLMTGENSIFKYWQNTTRGHLDFIDSPMFPWIDIALGADTSRGVQAKTAIETLRAKFPNPEPLGGLNGLIVLTHPGNRTMANPQAGMPGQPATITTAFDGGTTEIDGLPTAVLPVMSSDHTFMAHEVGHVLGFDHTFGLDNNGTDWDPNDANIMVGPEYGSPYDLMSSASFGSRWLGSGPFYQGSPTFTGSSVAGWPNLNAFSMGPHVSRANLHRWLPDALAGRVVEAAFPALGATVNARIVPASSSNGICLLILHPPGEPADGAGRVYVEYRTIGGWDKGLDPLGPDLAREGVVVHALVTQPTAVPHVWYRASIPSVSVDRDVSVPSTSLVVRADGFGPNSEFVDLTVTNGAARTVEIVRGNHSDDFVGVIGEVQPAGLCGVRKGTFAMATFSQFGVRTTGLGGQGGPGDTPATVTWTVGGVSVPEANGTIEVAVGEVTYTVEHTIDPVVFELALTSRGGERLEVPVVVTVTGDGTPLTAGATFTAPGWVDGVHPEDVGMLGDCLKRVADRLMVVPTPFRLPTPDPPWATMQIRRQTEQFWLVKTMRLLDELPGLDSEGLITLRGIVQLQVQFAPTMIQRLAASGIDFSVLESDLRDWLSNSEYTPYPAISEALLRQLGDRILRQPVFLDVIVFNYEHSQGNPSPRRLEDVDASVLVRALVDSFNQRYGNTVTSIEELLLPGA